MICHLGVTKTSITLPPLFMLDNVQHSPSTRESLTSTFENLLPRRFRSKNSRIIQRTQDVEGKDFIRRRRKRRAIFVPFAFCMVNRLRDSRLKGFLLTFFLNFLLKIDFHYLS